MRLTIMAVGRMKSGPENELLGRYLERAGKAGRQLGISAIRQLEFAESRRQDADGRKIDEAAQMVAALPPSAFAVLLDEKGDDCTSQAFALQLQQSLDSGISELVFMIGGPDGHGEAARSVARRTLRFGSATWPHQMVRIMLFEQIYRAITIMSGHPYHRD